MVTAGVGVQVVCRYQDGRLQKGITRDFFPNKPEFHLQAIGEGSPEVLSIQLSELKAVFFVKTLAGDRYRQPPGDLDQASGVGRRLRVVFEDDEALIGFTVGRNRSAPGFFMTPADDGSNNERIFVVNSAVAAAEWM